MAQALSLLREISIPLRSVQEARLLPVRGFAGWRTFSPFGGPCSRHHCPIFREYLFRNSRPGGTGLVIGQAVEEINQALHRLVDLDCGGPGCLLRNIAHCCFKGALALP